MKSKYKAIIYIILSAFSFAFMFAFVRLSGDLPTVQKTFFRNFVALFFAIGVLKKNHIRFHIEGKKNNAVIFVRALAGTLGMLGNFYAIDHSCAVRRFHAKQNVTVFRYHFLFYFP